MLLTRFCCIAAALLGAVAPPGAQARDPAAAAVLEGLRQADLRVATIAFRLATGATALCANTEPLSGMLIQDLLQYDPRYRPAAAALFNLDQGPAVEGVVQGSPADRAGVRAGDVLRAINGHAVDQIGGAGPARKTFDRTGRLLDAFEAGLRDGSLELDLLRNGKPLLVRFAGRSGCASRVQLVPGGRQNAGADGRTVTLSTALVDDVANDDQLAFMIAHEMSHNILGHRARLDGEGISFGLFAGLGRNASRIRKTEEEADYLGIYVMASAGYDPAAAPRFWQLFEQEHGPGIFADGTHLNGDKRVRFLQRAADEVLGKLARHEQLKPDIPAALAHD